MTRECAICGEVVLEGYIKCSKGHSRFVPVKDDLQKQIFSSSSVSLVQETLGRSSNQYSKDEIDTLTKQILEICNKSRISITVELVDRILADIEARAKARRDAELIAEKEKRDRHTQLIAKREKHDRWMRDIATLGIEKSMRNFRGGSYEIPESATVEILADTINLQTYNQMPELSSRSRPTTVFSDNQDFWNSVLQNHMMPASVVELLNFDISEWIPSSPGRYFTTDAINARFRAINHLAEDGAEYLPLGKREMILGGVGCVRLGIQRLRSSDIYILCASSNGISHQGIPIILEADKFDNLVSHIHRFGGSKANIIGQLQVFPKSDYIIQYDRQIPRYCIFVRQITLIEPSEKMIVSVAVTYSEAHQEYRIREKNWSFVSFDPTKQPVQVATEWLVEYVKRYNGHTSSILGDFDEYHQHFDANIEIEFPIRDVLQGNFNHSRLEQYRQRYNFTVNVQGDYYAMGHNFSNSDFRSAIVNIDSTLTEVSQTISNYSGNGKDLKSELIQLIEQLKAELKNVPEQSVKDAQKVARRADELISEALQPEPDKQEVEERVSKLKLAAENIASVAPVVVGIAVQIVNQIIKLVH